MSYQFFADLYATTNTDEILVLVMLSGINSVWGSWACALLFSLNFILKHFSTCSGSSNIYDKYVRNTHVIPNKRK